MRVRFSSMTVYFSRTSFSVSYLKVFRKVKYGWSDQKLDQKSVLEDWEKETDSDLLSKS